jgi:hypothetical protein
VLFFFLLDLLRSFPASGFLFDDFLAKGKLNSLVVDEFSNIADLGGCTRFFFKLKICSHGEFDTESTSLVEVRGGASKLLALSSRTKIQKNIHLYAHM